MNHDDQISVPRVPLASAMVLLVGTLVAVGATRLAGQVPDSASRAEVVAERVLRFEDRPDGRVVAIEPGAPATEWVVARPGEGGFLRGTLRALARERRAMGLGAEQPLRLVAHADGRISLEDAATARRIDLESFGPTNAGAFARLLTTAHADGAEAAAVQTSR